METNKKQAPFFYYMSRLNWLHKISTTALPVIIYVKDRQCNTDSKMFILREQLKPAIRKKEALMLSERIFFKTR
jgi:hypothetical protein